MEVRYVEVEVPVEVEVEVQLQVEVEVPVKGLNLTSYPTLGALFPADNQQRVPAWRWKWKSQFKDLT